jgi:hypothetical protein
MEKNNFQFCQFHLMNTALCCYVTKRDHNYLYCQFVKLLQKTNRHFLFQWNKFCAIDIVFYTVLSADVIIFNVCEVTFKKKIR